MFVYKHFYLNIWVPTVLGAASGTDRASTHCLIGLEMSRVQPFAQVAHDLN